MSEREREIRQELDQKFRELRAAFDAVAAVTAVGGDPFNQISATFDADGFLIHLAIVPTCLHDHTHVELGELITDVLRDGTARVREATDAALQSFWPASHASQQVSGPVVLERSADRALTVEVDESGTEVRVQLEAEVLRCWSSERLAKRIMRLHRLALMRARAEKRAQIVESGVVLPATAGYPALCDVEQYRRTIYF